MLKSVVVGASLLALVSVVGCAEPVELEDQGNSASQQTAAYPKTSHDRLLDTLEAKANNCDVFTDSEIKTLESYQNHVEWSFEAYVSFTCSYEGGELVVGGVSMEKRAGWSSSDGIFTEQALDATASFEVPLKAVELSGSVTKSVTVRQANATVTHNQSVSVAGSVSKNLGVVKGTASVSFDGNGSVTVAGGASVPLPVSAADCKGGKQKVGFTVSLTAEQVLDNQGLSDAAARALRARAVKIQTRGHQNFLATSAPGESAATKKKLHDECCAGWGTCR